MTEPTLPAASSLSQDIVDAALRNDFLAFTEKVFHNLHPTKTFHHNWHLEAIANCLELVRKGQLHKLNVNVPPRSLKSIMISIALPAFLLGHDPSAEVVCISYAKDFSEKLGRRCRKIMQSDWYRRIFPQTVISRETVDSIETTQGGSRLSTSFEGVIMGLGGGIIIIDDPIKPHEISSRAALDRVIRNYRETLLTRMDDKVNGAIIIVMQRLHEDDLSGHLLREGGFHHLNFPAIAVTDEVIDLGGGKTHRRCVNDLLQPIREPIEVLDLLRKSMGTAAFEAQYQQNPIPASGNMVKVDWLKTYSAQLDRTGLKVTISCDTASKGDPSADYTVCTVWGERNGLHHLLDVYRRKLDFPDLLKAVVDLHRQYSPHALLIEDHGAGTSLIQQLRSQHQIYAIGRRCRDDKATRLSVVLPMFEAGQVLIPEEAPWRTDLLHELFGFPLTRHDDQVDSISQYLAWTRDTSSRLFEADFGMSEPDLSMDYVVSAVLAMRRF